MARGSSPESPGRKVRMIFLVYCSASLFYYRQDAAKRQTVGNKFTHRPKIRFFAPQGRLVAPIHVKLGRADGHVGLLGCAKFHLNRHRGWECGPQNIKNFHFLVKSRPDRFRKVLGVYTPNHHASVIQI